MMIGETIFPGKIEVFASNFVYAAGVNPGTATKTIPPGGVYAEGFEQGVANVLGSELNYVLNALTQQAITSRDQMLLPQTVAIAHASDPDINEIKVDMHDPGFANPLRNDGITYDSSYKVVDISPYHYVRCFKTGNNAPMRLHLYTSSPSPPYATEFTTNLNQYNGGYGISEKLFFDHYHKRIYLVNVNGARRYESNLSGQSTLAAAFTAEGVTVGCDRYAAANGVLVKAYRTSSDLRVIQSTDGGTTVANTVVLSNVTTTTEGSSAVTSPRMPIALDWVPPTATQVGRFVLVTRDGGTYTSTNGSTWVNQRPHGLFKTTGYTPLGMLSSAAFVGESIVAMLPYSEQDITRRPAIIITDDYFNTFRVYPTKYTHVQSRGQRLHYAHAADSIGWPTTLVGDYSYLPVLTRDGFSFQAFSQRLVKMPNMVQTVAEIGTPGYYWP